MSKKRKGAAAALATVLALLVAVTLLEVADYTPSFCALCHRLERASWRVSTHSNASCRDCHSAKGSLGGLRNSLRRVAMLSGGLTGAYEKPVIASVDSRSCLDCHAQIAEDVVTRFGIRMRHVDVMKAGIACTKCHNTVAHGKATASPKGPFMDTCTPCHKGEKASSKCETCHTSQIARIPTPRLAPWAITHGERWSKTHGMGNAGTCSLCHPGDFCSRCHGMNLPHDSTWPLVHGKAAIANASSVPAKDKPRRCTGCHVVSYCDGCHGVPMPHPKGFLPKHKQEHKRVGRRVCMNCHIQSECNECHEKHVHPGKLRDPLLTEEAKEYWRKR